ncbi:MAG: hypothetical protein AAF821_00135 [Cyanobacteria bacterium P01_D01_bin.156]
MVTMKSLEIPDHEHKGTLILLNVYSGPVSEHSYSEHPDVLQSIETMGGYSIVPFVKNAIHKAGEISVKPIKYMDQSPKLGYFINRYRISGNVGLLNMQDTDIKLLLRQLEESPHAVQRQIPGIFLRCSYGLSGKGKYVHNYYALGLVPGVPVDISEPIIISSGWLKRLK